MRPSIRHTLWLGPLSLVVGLFGCIHRTEPIRLSTPQAVAIAFVQDDENGAEVMDAPEAVKEAVLSALAARNLRAEPVDPQQVRQVFKAVRASERRLAWLKESTDAPWALLVETRARFFSQLGGRYRWVALARLTAQDRASGAAPITRDFEEGVVLQFDHQRAPEALEIAAPRIGDAAGALFDDLLVVPSHASHRLPQPGAIYFVMVDRFANGDPSNDGAVDPADPAAFHGGDLQGVIDHLDSLQALGVQTVWLSPIFKTRTTKFFGFGAFHGYWVYDLTEVEPRFGDRRLLRRLSDELHRRGMKLLLDVVLNHVGPDAPLVKEKPAWFHHRGPLEHWDDPDEVQMHDVFGLPDLAQENPEVYAYLLDASLKWIRDVEPDGFRLDAVKHVPVSFWRRYTADVRRAAGDGFLLLGEMLDGNVEVVARTWREGGFDAVFDFPLKYAVEEAICRSGPLTHLSATLSLDRLYADPSALVTLADNHDFPRIVTACGGDLEKVKQVLTVLFTARGTPSLTWGTEAALTGAKEPENRGDMRFDSQPLAGHLTQLLKLRRTHPALVHGAPYQVEVDQDLWVEARILPDEAALILVNRTDRPIELHPNDAGLRRQAGTIGYPVSATDRGAVPGPAGAYERARDTQQGAAPERADAYEPTRATERSAAPDPADGYEAPRATDRGAAPELGDAHRHVRDTEWGAAPVLADAYQPVRAAEWGAAPVLADANQPVRAAERDAAPELGDAYQPVRAAEWGAAPEFGDANQPVRAAERDAAPEFGDANQPVRAAERDAAPELGDANQPVRAAEWDAAPVLADAYQPVRAAEWGAAPEFGDAYQPVRAAERGAAPELGDANQPVRATERGAAPVLADAYEHARAPDRRAAPEFADAHDPARATDRGAAPPHTDAYEPARVRAWGAMPELADAREHVRATHRSAAPERADAHESAHEIGALPGALASARWIPALGAHLAPGGAVRIPPYSAAVCFARAPTPGAFAALHEQAERIWRGTATSVDVLFHLGNGASPEGELRLIGSAPELGGWDPKVAPSFHVIKSAQSDLRGPQDRARTSDGTHRPEVERALAADAGLRGDAAPSGRVVRLQLPPGTYEYKLVSTRPAAEPVWESGANRVLVVPPGPGGGRLLVDVSLDWEQPAVVARRPMD